jgi:hypothetical protein
VIPSLAPPADLAAARARLGDLAAHDPTGAPVTHLARLADPVVGPDWPALPDGPVVAVADGVLADAGLANLRRLARTLGPDRVLWYLEPTADVGWRRAVQLAGRPLWRGLTGHSFDADIPWLLRSVGLQLTDIDRFGVGPGGLCSYVLGRAVRHPER